MMPIDCEDKDLTEIDERLFVGNIEIAQNHYSMQKHNITLVIAVYPKKLIGISVQLRPAGSRYHHIDANDIPHEDLISHFDVCYDLMYEELEENKGSVLVFCGAGYSRSVTIVSAYLMRKYGIGSEEAVERVRLKRPKIRPNKGFMAQLYLYQQMGYKLDKTNNEYRAFMVTWLKRFQRTEIC